MIDCCIKKNLYFCRCVANMGCTLTKKARSLVFYNALYSAFNMFVVYLSYKSIVYYARDL